MLVIDVITLSYVPGLYGVNSKRTQFQFQKIDDLEGRMNNKYTKMNMLGTII